MIIRDLLAMTYSLRNKQTLHRVSSWNFAVLSFLLFYEAHQQLLRSFYLRASSLAWIGSSLPPVSFLYTCGIHRQKKRKKKQKTKEERDTTEWREESLEANLFTNSFTPTITCRVEKWCSGRTSDNSWQTNVFWRPCEQRTRRSPFFSAFHVAEARPVLALHVRQNVCPSFVQALLTRMNLFIRTNKTIYLYKQRFLFVRVKLFNYMTETFLAIQLKLFN